MHRLHSIQYRVSTPQNTTQKALWYSSKFEVDCNGQTNKFTSRTVLNCGTIIKTGTIQSSAMEASKGAPIVTQFASSQQQHERSTRSWRRRPIISKYCHRIKGAKRYAIVTVKTHLASNSNKSEKEKWFYHIVDVEIPFDTSHRILMLINIHLFLLVGRTFRLSQTWLSRH